MSTVSNTSPLIWLAKIGKLRLLKDLFGAVNVTEQIYKEAVEKGLDEGFSDALVIKDAYDQGWIKIMSLEEKDNQTCQSIIKNTFELHVGEAQAIVLARKMGKDTLLLIDDSSGRAFAEAWGVKVKGTLYVIMAAKHKGFLNDAEAKETVLSLVRKGFRLEPTLLARIITEIEQQKLPVHTHLGAVQLNSKPLPCMDWSFGQDAFYANPTKRASPERMRKHKK